MRACLPERSGGWGLGARDWVLGTGCWPACQSEAKAGDWMLDYWILDGWMLACLPERSGGWGLGAGDWVLDRWIYFLFFHF